MRQPHLLPLSLLLLSPAALADPEIYNDSDRYAYSGCFTETTDLANTTHERALPSGPNAVGTGNMTVPVCLAYCSGGADGNEYQYAGLEFSRECWCSNTISGLTEKLDDAECNLACDGNGDMVCGGSMKLSVYEVSGAVRSSAGVIAVMASMAFSVALFAS